MTFGFSRGHVRGPPHELSSPLSIEQTRHKALLPTLGAFTFKVAFFSWRHQPNEPSGNGRPAATHSEQLMALLMSGHLRGGTITIPIQYTPDGIPYLLLPPGFTLSSFRTHMPAAHPSSGLLDPPVWVRAHSCIPLWTNASRNPRLTRTDGYGLPP